MQSEHDEGADRPSGGDATLPGFPQLASAANDGAVAGSEDLSFACLAAARHILNSRRLRLQMFDRGMFGEPAWDMLLLLFINEASSIPTGPMCLARALEVPSTVAFRWQSYLEREGLIDCTQDERVHLTAKARKILTQYLTRVSGVGTTS